MDGYAAHGNGCPTVIAASGEGNAQGHGGLLSVFEEKLIEIAHPKEDKGVWLTGLGLKELGHHRRGASGIGRSRGQGWIVSGHGRRTG